MDKPDKAPDNESIPVPDVGECLGQTFALGLSAALFLPKRH